MRFLMLLVVVSACADDPRPPKCTDLGCDPHHLVCTRAGVCSCNGQTCEVDPPVGFQHDAGVDAP